MTRIDPIVELLRRRLGRETVDDYASYMAASQHLDFIHPPARHHRLITRLLDRLLLPEDHPDRLRDAEGNPAVKLLLTAPPGSAKSTYLSVQFATYYLMCHPTHHVLCSSNVDDLAKSFNRRRRSACQTQEWQNLAETSLNPDASSVDRFYTLQGGSCMAAGVGKTIVGIRTNLNVLDDPIQGWEQAQSEAQLGKIWDWYEGEYRNRLVPNGLEVVMHQRWARNDVAGVLLRLIRAGEETGWAVVNLPLVAPEAQEEPDPLGRTPGEVLWPEWYTARQLKEWQRDPTKWAAIYQQKPIDEEGAWVGQEHIQLIQPGEWAKMRQRTEYKFLGGLDLALSTRKGDWTVLGMSAITPERDIIICDIHRRQQAPEMSVKDLYRMHQEYRPVGWLMDDDNATKVFTKLVAETARSQSISPPPLELMPMHGRDKEIRAAAFRGYARGGRVRIVNDARWAPDLIQEMLAFPGEPDDQIDFLGLIGRKMVVMGGASPPEPPPDRRRGYVVERDGRLLLNVPLEELVQEREASIHLISRRSRRL